MHWQEASDYKNERVLKFETTQGTFFMSMDCTPMDFSIQFEGFRAFL